MWGSVAEGTLRWAAFGRVVGTPDYLYLYVGKSAATIVPRRAFGSPAAAAAFLEAAAEWHAPALTGRVPACGWAGPPKPNWLVWALVVVVAVVVLTGGGVLRIWWLGKRRGSR